MNSRPPSVTVVGWLFIAAGAVGLVHHAGDLRTLRPLEYALVCTVRLLAVVGGVFLLRGRDWARWLVVVWMAAHVLLSILHTPVELAVHAVFLAAIVFLLFRPSASAYFRAGRTRFAPP